MLRRTSSSSHHALKPVAQAAVAEIRHFSASRPFGEADRFLLQPFLPAFQHQALLEALAGAFEYPSGREMLQDDWTEVLTPLLLPQAKYAILSWDGLRAKLVTTLVKGWREKYMRDRQMPEHPLSAVIARALAADRGPANSGAMFSAAARGSAAALVLASIARDERELASQSASTPDDPLALLQSAEFRRWLADGCPETQPGIQFVAEVLIRQLHAAFPGTFAEDDVELVKLVLETQHGQGMVLQHPDVRQLCSAAATNCTRVRLDGTAESEKEPVPRGVMHKWQDGTEAYLVAVGGEIVDDAASSDGFEKVLFSGHFVFPRFGRVLFQAPQFHLSNARLYWPGQEMDRPRLVSGA